MKKKYLVIGGLIHSMNDEDIHFISARKLVDLYNVWLEECILVDNVKSPDFFMFRNCRELIWLMPRSSGNYILPNKEQADRPEPKRGFWERFWDRFGSGSTKGGGYCD